MWRQRAYDVAIYSLVAVGAWWVARGVWGAGVEAYETITSSLSERYDRWSDARPPRPLPERTGDRERYPRRGFGLVLEDTRGFRVDTFAGTATKDMIQLPDTTIELRLSDAQLDTLYDMVVRMRLFDDPRPRSLLRSDHGQGREFEQLTVRTGTSTTVLEWSHWIWASRPEPRPDDWKRFDNLVGTIGRMVRTHPAYAALPPAKGIYID